MSDKEEIERLRAQRDELLATLRGIRHHFECHCGVAYTSRGRHHHACLTHELESIDAAIAKATGGGT